MTGQKPPIGPQAPDNAPRNSERETLARVRERWPGLGADVGRIEALIEEREALEGTVASSAPRASTRGTPRFQAQMGITVVQKSDLSRRRKDPKVALVLAGGAVSGGAFKLGGLKAFDDFLLNRKTTDFDIHVGLSAGAFLAAPLGCGITPAELLRILEGSSEEFSPFRAMDFYNPNLPEFLSKPVRYVVDLITFVPGAVVDFLSHSPQLLRALEQPVARYLRRPTVDRLWRVLEPVGEALLATRPFPFPLDYLPSGIFDNSAIERYMRLNFARRGIPNDFQRLFELTRHELYIVAMNLDTAERVVFGHDEDSSATISEAVQASTALPGFYRPAHINNTDYVDGGVRRTANIDVAIEHWAELVICYNPFRPFTNLYTHRYDPERGTYAAEGRPLASEGILTVLNQVLRTLLHSRLHLGLRQYQEDPHFQGDIILLEPAERDLKFFQMKPLAFWQRRKAARHGYLSVTKSIETHYDLIRRILESYGILMSHRQVREGVERIFQADDEEGLKVLTRDVPRRELSVAKG